MGLLNTVKSVISGSNDKQTGTVGPSNAVIQNAQQTVQQAQQLAQQAQLAAQNLIAQEQKQLNKMPTSCWVLLSVVIVLFVLFIALSLYFCKSLIFGEHAPAYLIQFIFMCISFCICWYCATRAGFHSLRAAARVEWYRQKQYGDPTFYSPALEDLKRRVDLKTPFTYAAADIGLFLSIQLLLVWLLFSGVISDEFPFLLIDILTLIVFLAAWYVIAQYDLYVVRPLPIVQDDPRVFMKVLLVKLTALENQAPPDIRSRIHALYETAKYSNPGTYAFLVETDQAIDAQVDELGRAVARNKPKDIDALCSSLSALIIRRDEMCKHRFASIPPVRDYTFKEWLNMRALHGGGRR